MRRRAPATQRNRDPIAAVLREELPAAGLVLEIASGTGEHACHFAGLFPALEWQPSDPDPASIESIAAWRDHCGYANMRAPLMLNAASDDWPCGCADAMLCVNMVHISPWAATLGLLDGASRILPKGAPLLLYGPYRRDDVPTAPSNLAFDADLRARNPEWGIRRMEDVTAQAAARDLVRTRVVDMPANNLMILFRRG